MDVTLPTRTWDECLLPDGTQVYLSVLNTLHKEEADRKARRHAQAECRSLLKGGSDYAAVVAEIKAFSPEEQATYIAGQEYWSIREKVEAELPLPIEPEQGEKTPEAFAKAYAGWEADCRKIEERRRKRERELFEQERQKALDLTPAERRVRCHSVYFVKEFVNVYATRMELETLYRAVRLADARTQRYFGSVEEVAYADDAVRERLWERYQSLDVSPAAIPTSAANSSV
jgi:hypothetical protein